MVLAGISHAGGHFKFTALFCFVFFPPTDHDRFFLYFYFILSISVMVIAPYLCRLNFLGLDLRHKFVELQKEIQGVCKMTAAQANCTGGLNNQFNNIILAVLCGACTR